MEELNPPRDPAALEAYIGCTVLVETHIVQERKGSWTEQELWRIVGIHPDHGLTLERAIPIAGHVMYLGWNAELLSSCGSLQPSGDQPLPDYMTYQQLRISTDEG